MKIVKIMQLEDGRQFQSADEALSYIREEVREVLEGLVTDPPPGHVAAMQAWLISNRRLLDRHRQLGGEIEEINEYRIEQEAK